MSTPSPTRCTSIPFSTASASLPAHSSNNIPRRSNPKPLIILDDDPTGTQTVHDLPVLTLPLPMSLLLPLLRSLPDSRYNGFFILTNSRALVPAAARALLIPLLRTILAASEEAGLGRDGVDVVLRSDSTLRGHFPLENELVEEVMGGFDAWVVAPAFFEGGRVTIEGVHYALDHQEGEGGGILVPVGETASARDASFGFSSSAVGEWVGEKLGVNEQVDVVGIGIGPLRAEDAVALVSNGIAAAVTRGKEKGRRVVIVPDSFDEKDMAAFVAGCNAVPHLRLLYRTAASLVSARLGIEKKPPVPASELFMNKESEKATGGLIIIGSYVPRTTAQREYLLKHCEKFISHFELDVEELLKSRDDNRALVGRIAEASEDALREGKDAVISTSRRLITSEDKAESLRLGNIVSAVLVQITKTIKVRPRYVIAKGGITSSDIATEALGIKQATVVGQAAIGVPLWRSEPVGEPKWLNLPYVVFPGNVGNAQLLGDLVRSYRFD